jgi:hypothetical protein
MAVEPAAASSGQRQLQQEELQASAYGHYPVQQHQPSSATISTDDEAAAVATTTTTATKQQQFACLYTRHKTQKHKTWRDGRLIVNQSCCRLYDADPAPGSGDPMIDTCALESSEVARAVLAGQRTDLETEKFLITIDGPWQPKIRCCSSSSLTTIHNKTTSTTTTTSKGMAKLLQTKFREPKRVGPPPPPPSSFHPDRQAKRPRPLQPGELQNRYYGAPTLANASASHLPPGPQPANFVGAVGHHGPPPPMYHQQQQHHRPPPPQPPPRQVPTTTRPSDFVSNQDFRASSFYEDEEEEPEKTTRRTPPFATSKNICHTAAPAAVVNAAHELSHAAMAREQYRGGNRHPTLNGQASQADDRYADDLSQSRSPWRNEPNPTTTGSEHSQVDVSWFGPPAVTSPVGATLPPTTTPPLPPATTVAERNNNETTAPQQPPAPRRILTRPTGPSAAAMTTTSTTIGCRNKKGDDSTFVTSSNFRASQYYEEEEEEDDDDPAASGVPLAFVVPMNHHHSTARDPVARAELLDIFSDPLQPPPTTTAAPYDEFVLPENSSSDEE